MASEEGLGWPKQAIAKEFIDRVKQRHWGREWSATGTAANLADLLQSALDRIEELEPSPVKVVWPEVYDLLHAVLNLSNSEIDFAAGEIQAVLDRYAAKPVAAAAQQASETFSEREGSK